MEYTTLYYTQKCVGIEVDYIAVGVTAFCDRMFNFSSCKTEETASK